MGYQEALIYTEKMDQLLSGVRTIGKEYLDERGVCPVEIITINTDQTQFEKGTRLLWVTGERSYQREIFGQIEGLFNDVLKLEDYQYIFIEDVNDELFGENNEYLFNHEPFNWNCDNNVILSDTQLRELYLYKKGYINNSELWSMVESGQIIEWDTFSSLTNEEYICFNGEMFIDVIETEETGEQVHVLFEQGDQWEFKGQM